MLLGIGLLKAQQTIVETNNRIGSNAFKPDTLSNLWFWIDASDTTTLLEENNILSTNYASKTGDSVSIWKDKSGNDFHVSQTTSSFKPKLRLGYFNGQNALDFDLEDRLQHILPSNMKDDFTMYIILMSDTASPTNFESFYSSHTNPNTSGSFQIDYNSSTNSFQVRSKLGGANQFSRFNTFVHDTIKLFGISYNNSTGQLVTYDNGAANDTITNPDIFHSRIRVNVNRNENRRHNSHIAEIIIYKKELDFCENDQVLKYLNAKYSTSFVNSFAPASTGCENNSVWLKSDNGPSSLVNGVTISSWTNLSNLFGLLSAQQTIVSKQPTFYDSSTFNINYNPVIHFDGNNDAMTIPLSTELNANDMVIFSVQKLQSGSGGNRTIYGSLNTSVPSTGYGLRVNSSNQYELITGNLLTGFLNNDAYGTANNRPNIISYTLKAGFGSATKSIDVNGANIGTIINGNYGANLVSSFYIGADLLGLANFWEGEIAELIIFNDEIDSLRKMKINTYLAIKYGVTLSHNYVSSSDKVLYDVSNGYANGVLGVGRDLGSDLYQPKSKSETDITSGFTIELTSTLGNDAYALVGHNGASLARHSLVGINNVLLRKWYSNHTGGIGTLDIALDLNVFSSSETNPNNVKILISNTASFDHVYTINATSISNGIATFEGIPLYDKYFTFSIP